MPLLSKNDHDIPSMYMPHRQTSASQILDTTEPKPFEDATRVHADLPKKPSVIEDEEGEANIHHIAKVTFDGNPAKGQLSFMSGSEVLAHSNQRGEWWLGRCGGRTGWFPASAVVPASEYLSCDGPSLGEHNTDEEEVDDVDLEFPILSQEEIHEVYDLIRSPSGEDESPRKAAARDADSTEEQPNELFVRDVRSAYDSMLDEYDSMLAPASEQSNAKEDRSLNVSAETKQSELNTITSSGEKKPKRLWRSANDPNTGLTYYYNVKTREVSNMSDYIPVIHFYQPPSYLIQYVSFLSDNVGKAC
jgi:rhodanese-related sulfurtransferase